MTINVLQAFQVDPEAEDAGVWVDLYGTSFRIRAMGSPEVQRAVQKLNKKYDRARQANDGVLPPDLVDEESGQQCAAMVTGWKNMPDPDRPGETLDYSPDAARALFTRRDLRRLRVMLFAEATNHENFRAEQVKAVEGNSGNASPGPSASARPRKA